jgi:hypothetical protein
VAVVPAARAVVVVTGDPRFDPGPPASDQLQPGECDRVCPLVTEHLLPALRETA